MPLILHAVGALEDLSVMPGDVPAGAGHSLKALPEHVAVR
jgi:hypothetical protein